MKKRNLAIGTALVAVVAIALATWIYAGSATAHPGNTCNPDPGHGNPGCHVAPTTTTAKPTTTTAKPTTTAGPTTTTAGPTTTATGTDEGGGLSGGWIALIVVVGAIALAGSAGIAFILRRSRRS